MRKRVRGVSGDRLLKVLDGLLKAFVGSFVPPKAAVEIVPIGFRIGGMDFGYVPLVLSREAEAKRLGDFFEIFCWSAKLSADLRLYC